MIGLLRALVAAYPNPLAATTEHVRAALSRAAQALEGAGPSLATPDYEILETVGRGGMGIVYKAWQPALKRVVALKVLTDGAAASPERLQRFQIEAEAAARLRHPNIVQIYAIGEGADGPWLALEWVEGGGLNLRLRQGLFDIRVAAELVRALASAVQQAHAAGIVHRDLKPANVLLSADGTPKITDFGLARFLSDADGLTRTGDVLGTPGYMAPEQAAGRAAEAGPATDVWALGAILYECLTGRRAFNASTWQETIRQVQEEEPPAPRAARSEVPRDLEAICLKCLSKAPADRYASAQDLADDLGRWLAGESVRARPPSLWRRADRWVRRLPELGGMALATLCIVGILLVAQFAAFRVWEWEVAMALALGVAGYAAVRTGQRAVALGAVGSGLALLTWAVVEVLGHSAGLPAGVGPLVVAAPTLLAALASAWWWSSPLLKAILPVGVAGLVLLLLTANLPGMATRPGMVIAWSYVAVGVFGVCGIARGVANYFAAPFVAVVLGCLCGAFLGLFPAVVAMCLLMPESNPCLFQLVAICFPTAGALLGAITSAARRRGVRIDFGVYPTVGLGPAIEVLGFQGPPMRLSASQLRELADLLDRYEQTFQLRPVVGQSAMKALLPAPDAEQPTPDQGRP
jgi:hypothetical protein